ncbi:hypothetical protein TNCV_1488741 [Trichonephila clavipes]|nr:hypothetical protein TNCV_1488741 [Trichonephila clavipes]
MEPRITPTLNVNSECFQPKQTIPSCVESFENGGEFVGHSTMLLSTALVYCLHSRGEVLFLLRAPTAPIESVDLNYPRGYLILGLKCEKE